MRFLAASVGTICALGLLPASAPTAGAGDADVAALQVALRASAAYVGPVDGWRGPDTDEALLAFQQRAGLEPDGIVGPRTRHALGRFGRPELGRPLVGHRRTRLGRRRAPVRARVARLSLRAVRRRLRPTPGGRRAPLPALRAPAANRRRGTENRRRATQARPTSPLALSRPVVGELGDGFGPRGGSFHAGLDFIVAAGTPVTAARAGRVVLGGAAGQLRQRRRRRTRQRRSDALRTSLADRRRPARPCLARRPARHGRLDRTLDRPRTSTSRCGCAALPSTRSAR